MIYFSAPYFSAVIFCPAAAPSRKAELAKARALIETHGYWRRKEELEDAEAALGMGE